MNTYLSLWQEDRLETMRDVIRKTEEVTVTMSLRHLHLPGAALDADHGEAPGEPRGVGDTARRQPGEQQSSDPPDPPDLPGLDHIVQITRSHLAKLAERQKIFDSMKRLQLTKLNRC